MVYKILQVKIAVDWDYFIQNHALEIPMLYAEGY